MWMVLVRSRITALLPDFAASNTSPVSCSGSNKVDHKVVLLKIQIWGYSLENRIFDWRVLTSQSIPVGYPKARQS
jgi:hypothetical protein